MAGKMHVPLLRTLFRLSPGDIHFSKDNCHLLILRLIALQWSGFAGRTNPTETIQIKPYAQPISLLSSSLRSILPMPRRPQSIRAWWTLSTGHVADPEPPPGAGDHRWLEGRVLVPVALCSERVSRYGQQGRITRTLSISPSTTVTHLFYTSHSYLQLSERIGRALFEQSKTS